MESEMDDDAPTIRLEDFLVSELRRMAKDLYYGGKDTYAYGFTYSQVLQAIKEKGGMDVYHNFLEEIQRAENKRKDEEFARLKDTNSFPANISCARCLDGAWCCKHGHHVGDCCLHCGNDEREVG